MQPCGHLLGKGWSLEFLVCDVFLCFVNFTYGALGQVWCLIVLIPNICFFLTLVPDLNLSITNGIVSSKIYDKRDDFNFEIVNFPFLDGDVSRSPSYGVYISQLIRYARV